MFKPPRRPFFPNLISTEKNNRREDKPADVLYTLDWNYKEKSTQKDVTKPRYIVTTPELRKWLDEQTFRLSQSYIREINYQTSQAVEEYNHYCGMDTAVRDYLLAAPQTHIDNAFYLVCDGLELKGRSFKYKSIVHSMLLLRFWENQTGDGLIVPFSDIGKLDRLESSDFDKDDKWLQVYINNLLVD